MNYTTDIITWRGLDIEVRYNTDWSQVYREMYVHAIGHLEIRCLSGRALPISETGYKSQFDSAENIAAKGGAAAYVLAWLDQAANSQCGAQTIDTRQLALF